jgi:hypothetical protein
MCTIGICFVTLTVLVGRCRLVLQAPTGLNQYTIRPKCISRFPIKPDRNKVGFKKDPLGLARPLALGLDGVEQSRGCTNANHRRQITHTCLPSVNHVGAIYLGLHSGPWPNRLGRDCIGFRRAQIWRGRQSMFSNMFTRRLAAPRMRGQCEECGALVQNMSSTSVRL